MLATIVFAALALSMSAAAHLPAGSWLGWAFFDDNSDMPLRVQIHSDGTAAFDGVVWKKFGWEASLERDEAGQVVLTSATSKGTPITLTGEFAGGGFAGDLALGEYPGRFELLLAAEPVESLDPATYADLAGYYSQPDGDVLEVRARDWGELVLRSIRSGEQRTLFPKSTTEFWTGPAIYDPRRVESRLAFERNDNGRVVAVSLDGERGERFDLRFDDVEFVADGDTLRGLTTQRDDDLPRDGVVLIGGSGWRERRDHIFHLRNLAALGYRVLSYDKRGFGGSGGSDPSSFDRAARDAVAGAQWLRRQPGVARVGYMGISRGGWIAPIAVHLDTDAAFAILIVPPATSPAVQEHGSRLARMREDGFDEATTQVAERMLEANWAFSRGEGKWENYSERVEAARAAGVPDYVFGPTTPDPIEWEWARLNMHFDPTPYLESLDVPVLVIFGEHDLSVLTEVHRPRLDRLLAAAGNDDVTIHVIEGVGHGLSRRSDLPIHLFRGVGPEGYDRVLEWERPD